MLQEFPRRFRDTVTELIEGKAAGIFPFLEELNIVVRYWNGQERYQAVESDSLSSFYRPAASASEKSRMTD